jgi:hypothetical protein
MTMMLIFGTPGQAPPPAWFFAFLPFVIAFCAYFSMCSAAYLTGWKRLEKRFATDVPFVGTLWRWQSISMRYGSHYNNCAIVGASAEGLYLSLPWWIGFGHKDLLIPWSELARTGTQRVLWVEMIGYRIGSEEHIPLMLRSGLVAKIEQARAENYPVR